MKKKQLILLPLLALFLSSCLFDSDDDGLSSWLSKQGMPSSYKVQTVTVDDLNPISAEIYSDTFPQTAWGRGVFGAGFGVTYDAVFDFALDSSFIANLEVADSAQSIFFLYLVDSYYGSKYLPSDFFPIKEDLKLNVSWILSDKLNINEYYALETLNDYEWFEELQSWDAKKSADTTYSVSIDSKDSLLAIDMPRAIVDDVRKNSGHRRLQLRISAPEASHVYRFYGPGHSSKYASYRLIAVNDDTTFTYATYVPTRAASIVSNREECSDCLVLHGGGFDSLVVEFPSKPIMKALSDFYGDEFPYDVGDGNDVRQAVVMAQLSFFRDDSKGSRELDMPIQVVVGSYLDSADTMVNRLESYRLDKQTIIKDGHQNVVFHDGDSLTLQVTKGMRDFINRASDGRTFKMMMRLGPSVISEKDTIFQDRYTDEGDTVYATFAHYDYARYDFTSIRNKPARLKLWLASKRGEE